MNNKVNIKTKTINWLLLSCFFCLLTLAKAKPYTPQKYIDKFAPIAIQLSIETQIPSSVILGVAIVESGFGNSKNCRLLNNHFGVKGIDDILHGTLWHVTAKEGYDIHDVMPRVLATNILFNPFGQTGQILT